MTKKKVDTNDRLSFSSVLFSTKKPTINGNIYTVELLERVMESFTKKPAIIIQEMREVEKRIKKIPLAEPWAEKAMADVVSGEIIDGELIFHALCRNNKEGKLLEGVINTIGMEGINFFPVGYGTTDENKVINPDYKLNYIALEPKKEKKRH